MNKNTIITIVLIVFVVLIIGGVFLYFWVLDDNEEETPRKIEKKQIQKLDKPKNKEISKKRDTLEKITNESSNISNNENTTNNVSKNKTARKKSISKNTPNSKKKKSVIINESRNVEIDPLISFNSDTEENLKKSSIMIPEKINNYKNKIEIINETPTITKIHEFDEFDEDYDEQFMDKLLTPPTQNTTELTNKIILDKNGDIMLYNPNTIHEEIPLLKQKININTPITRNNINKLIEYFPETTQHDELFSNLNVDVVDIAMVNDNILLLLLKDNKILYQSTVGGNTTEIIFESNNVYTQLTNIFYFGDKLYAVGKNYQLYNAVSTDFNNINDIEWTPSTWCDMSVYWFSITGNGSNLWIQSDIEGKMYKYIIGKDPIQEGAAEQMDKTIRVYGENINTWFEYDSRNGEGKDSSGKRHKNVYYVFYIDNDPQIISDEEHTLSGLIKGRYLQNRIFYIVK